MKSRLEIAMQNDPVMTQRIAARLATARASLMNNTKWREVLLVLRRSQHLVTPIHWKFVLSSSSYFRSVPSLHGLSLHPECLPDELPYPYGPYREIDWIEIPPSDPTSTPTKHNDLDALTGELQTLGQLPLTRTESGLRISGYVW